MNLSNYRHSMLLTQVMKFLRYCYRVRQLSPVHPTIGGCVVIVQDEDNGTIYRMSMDVVRSEIIVENADKLSDQVTRELTVNQVLKMWGEL